jgi:uncharacterized membrane protein
LAIIGLISVACVDKAPVAPQPDRGAREPASGVGIASGYTETLLPLLPTCAAGPAFAGDISDDLRIVGACGPFAVEWANGTIRSIHPPGFLTSRANAVNVGGVVAGDGFHNAVGATVGWLRRSDGTVLIIKNGGVPVRNAFPMGVSRAGVVVGCFSAHAGPVCERAFRWSELSGFESLHPPRASSSIAWGVNDIGGIVVGEAVIARREEAATWSLVGGFRTLGRVGGAASIAAINAAGRMVGWDLGPAVTRAAAWSPAGAPSLVAWPGDGEAHDISDRDRIVGDWLIFSGGSVVSRAAATERTGVVELLPFPLAMTWSSALAVERCGTIVGSVGTATSSRAVAWQKVRCD